MLYDCGQQFFKALKQIGSFSCFKSKKEENMTLSLLVETSLKGQALGDVLYLGSQKDKNDYLGSSRKKRLPGNSELQNTSWRMEK